MVNLLWVLVFILLAFLIFYIKRDFRSPSFILCITWTTSLLFLFFANERFESISIMTYFVYFVGTFMFFVGEITGQVFDGKYSLPKKVFKKNTPNSLLQREKVIINICLILLILSLLIYYKHITVLISSSIANIKTFFYQIRAMELKNAESTHGLSLISNFVPLSIIIATYFFNWYKEYKQKRIIIFFIIGIAIIFQLLTGGRAGAVYLVLALIGVELIKEKKIKVKNLVNLFVLLLCVIMFIAYFVSKGNVDNTKSLLANINAFYEDFTLYFLGGIVAFNQIVEEPGSIASNGGVKRFFLETARSLGFDVEVPSLHMQYTFIGHNLVTNVYTCYSYYFIDYGMIGTCIFMFFLGVISFLIYKRARWGGFIACPFYGFFIAGLVLTVFSEYFYTNLNFLIKSLIVIFFLKFVSKVKFFKALK